MNSTSVVNLKFQTCHKWYSTFNKIINQSTQSYVALGSVSLVNNLLHLASLSMAGLYVAVQEYCSHACSCALARNLPSETTSKAT